MGHVDEVEGGVEEGVEEVREAQTEHQEICLVSYSQVFCEQIISIIFSFFNLNLKISKRTV